MQSVKKISSFWLRVREPLFNKTTVIYNAKLLCQGTFLLDVLLKSQEVKVSSSLFSFRHYVCPHLSVWLPGSLMSLSLFIFFIYSVTSEESPKLCPGRGSLVVSAENEKKNYFTVPKRRPRSTLRPHFPLQISLGRARKKANSIKGKNHQESVKDHINLLLKLLQACAHTHMQFSPSKQEQTLLFPRPNQISKGARYSQTWKWMSQLFLGNLPICFRISETTGSGENLLI